MKPSGLSTYPIISEPKYSIFGASVTASVVTSVVASVVDSVVSNISVVSIVVS